MYVKQCGSPPQLQLALLDSLSFRQFDAESPPPSHLLQTPILLSSSSLVLVPCFCHFSLRLMEVIPTVFFGLVSQATHLTDSCCLYFSCHQIALVMRSWFTATPGPAKCFVAVLLLVVFHLICPDCQQLCRVGVRDNQDRLQRSLNSEECSWFPTRHHPAPPRHAISHWTSSTSVHRSIIHQPAQEVVQFCDMSCTIRSHLERPCSPLFHSILCSR